MHRQPDTQAAAVLCSAALATCTVIDLCYLPPDAMYQIVFNEISAAEMAKIPKKLQLELLAEFQFLPENLDHLDSKAFGVEPAIIESTSLAQRKVSWSIGSFTRTRSAISCSDRNCPWQKTNS